MAPRVFLVEPARRDVDVSPATQFGELVTVFEPPARRGHGSRVEDGAPLRRVFRPTVFDAEAYAVAFLEVLDSHGFDPDVDFLLLTGGQLPLCLAFGAMVARYGQFKTLAFNSTMNAYVDKPFDVEKVIKGETRWNRNTGTSSLIKR